MTAAFVLLCACAKRDHFDADIPAATPLSKTAGGIAARERAAIPAAAAPAERHTLYAANTVHRTAEQPLSAFSLDVDTASYGLVRSALASGRLPQAGAVRLEELINYFPSLPADKALHPLGSSPFAAGYEIAPCPWNDRAVLLLLTVAAGSGVSREAPPANLVFLVDVSGDMARENALPLARAALNILTEELRPQDTVSVVTFADRMRTVLPPTSGANKTIIRLALDLLDAGGATAGAGGVQQGYNQAAAHYRAGGTNRIILCTNGGFNMGVSSTEELTRLVRRNREKGVSLSVLGLGNTGSNDALLSAMAVAGNGNYTHVDTLQEAVKALHEDVQSTLHAAAADVKAMIEFNPGRVETWKQIGYEKRRLAAEDFADDRVAAAAVGRNRTVRVLYELTLAGGRGGMEPLRYSRKREAGPVRHAGELGYVKLRWKAPGGIAGEGTSRQESLAVESRAVQSSFASAGTGFRFIAAVAAFGMKLRGDAFAASWADIVQWAEQAAGPDPGGHRAEFVRLARAARSLSE